MKPKQVILVRTDIEMGAGKIASQVAHASLGAILGMMKKDFFGSTWALEMDPHAALYQWITKDFTKIVLDCPTLQEMLNIEDRCRQLGMNYCRITDNGDTVFNGVHTCTTMAIGPDWSDNLNIVTGHLKTLR